MKLRCYLHFLAILGLVTATAGAQALHVERLPNGTTLVVVAEPNATATSVAWPETGENGSRVRSVSGGELTVTAAITEALGGAPPPPLLAAVGAVQVAELRTLAEGLMGGAAPARISAAVAPAPPAEGGVERRLAAPGAESALALTLPLPAPGDWRRPALEVLGEALPELLAREAPELRTTRAADTVTLETAVDPELGELQLARLRLALERLGSDPEIDAGPLEAARTRLMVRRRVELESQPAAARRLVELWRDGGLDAVRRFLFGLDGVTPELVREAARDWLPEHPGAAVLSLPPRVFNPRFAPGPQQVRLDNDLAAAVLERPATSLAALCLQPVLTTDLDGEVAATVLARIARALRADPAAPGWVDVEADPARLELAAAPDGLDELLEALARALDTVGSDTTPVSSSSAEPRRRAVDLMAGLLGVGGELSPATLLRPANLAVGVVGPDGEAAAEALTKFLGGLPGGSAPLESRPLGAEEHRAAVPGKASALALALPFDTLDDAAQAVLKLLLEERGGALLPGCRVEVLAPLVPGRRVLVMVVSAPGPLDALEKTVRGAWKRWLGPVDEAELEPVRRRAAAAAAVAVSGAVGQAGAMAQLAAGTAGWRPAVDRQMALLGADPAAISQAMAAVPELKDLESTGAGPLPAATLPQRP